MVGGVKKDLRIISNNGKKMKVCNWICENATQDDFKNFIPLFDKINEIIKDTEKKK